MLMTHIQLGIAIDDVVAAAAFDHVAAAAAEDDVAAAEGGRHLRQADLAGH